MSISSDYLYILIIVAFGILGVIQKKISTDKSSSDTKNPASGKQNQEPFPRNIKDFETKVNPKNVVRQTFTSRKNSPIKKDEKSFLNTSEEGKQAVFTDIIKSSEANTEQETTGEDYSFHNTEEVKKAIIWSEIIKRKY